MRAHKYEYQNKKMNVYLRKLWKIQKIGIYTDLKIGILFRPRQTMALGLIYVYFLEIPTYLTPICIFPLLRGT